MCGWKEIDAPEKEDMRLQLGARGCSCRRRTSTCRGIRCASDAATAAAICFLTAIAAPCLAAAATAFSQASKLGNGFALAIHLHPWAMFSWLVFIFLTLSPPH
jgi:hypothetical protein